MLQLDHIFILVSPGAPEADALLDLGLLEGTSNVHPGQGTSNRRFFLANITIEFLYIHNIAEAVNGAGKKLRFVERAIDVDASPYGLVTRWQSSNSEPDFPAWHYQPDYFPEPMHFYVGENSDNFEEPLCICMPPAVPMPKSPQQPNNTQWSLTKLDIAIPGSTSSPTLTAFGQCERVNIVHNMEHQLQLVLHNLKGSESKKTFIPELSMTIES